jgi:FG-GAP-like repeat
MRKTTFRGAAAAVLSIGLVAVPFTQAQAAPAPTPGHFTRAPISGLASHRAELPALKNLSPSARADALRNLAPSPAASSLVGSVGITQIGSTCPTGQFPSAIHGESFEAGLPFPDPMDGFGFTVETGVGAPDGTHWANSSLLADDPAVLSFVTSNHDVVPQTGKVYLSFSYRGTFDVGSAFVGVNDDGGELTPSADWSTVNLDITSQATTSLEADGTVYAGFGHWADVATAGSFDVDDVTIYTCKAPPISGVRGDWSGQGTVDLMATRDDGTLWMYEGAGAGTVGRGVQVGSGWSTFTWQGSPGDVNGDRRTDLLARRSDGTLWYYPGKGYGTLGRGLQVGNGWNVMTSIATPGDFDRDGRPDVVARRTDGTLHLYRILPTGALRYVRAIGSGWNIMTSVIGMGDLNADKRGDLLAIRTDGTMFSYLSTGTGLARATTVTAGWNIMNKLTSPGDMNKDGRADLIARRTDGTLWFYAGRNGGGVLSGKQVGTGWNIMTNIL